MCMLHVLPIAPSVTGAASQTAVCLTRPGTNFPDMVSRWTCTQWSAAKIETFMRSAPTAARQVRNSELPAKLPGSTALCPALECALPSTSGSCTQNHSHRRAGGWRPCLSGGLYVTCIVRPDTRLVAGLLSVRSPSLVQPAPSR